MFVCNIQIEAYHVDTNKLLGLQIILPSALSITNYAIHIDIPNCKKANKIEKRIPPLGPQFKIAHVMPTVDNHIDMFNTST